MEKELSSGELARADFYSELCEKFKIISIEDGMNEDDWVGWTKMKTKLGKKSARAQIVGDDFLVTNVERIRKAIKRAQ